MAGRRRNREINIVSLSFLDVVSNAVGGLAFLLIITSLMIGAIVFAPPRILTEKLPDAYHGQEYATWLAAREGLGKYRWLVASGKLPDGLSLDKTSGQLSGIVKLRGEGLERRYEFSVLCEAVEDQPEATTRRAKADERRFALTVYRQMPVRTIPLHVISPADLPRAFRAQPYPLALAAEGGQPPYLWSIVGPMPPGLHLTREGVFEGQPGATGNFSLEVEVSGKNPGEKVKRRFVLVVAELYPPPPPVVPLRVVTTKIPAAVARRSYQLFPAAEGGRPPYRWSTVNGPAWLKTADGISFEGQPELQDVGFANVGWQVADDEGHTARTVAIALEVRPPLPEVPGQLNVRTLALPEARAKSPYAVTLAAEGGLSPYSWTGAVTPTDSGLSAKYDLVSGIPATPGPVSIGVSVSDTVGRTASRQFDLRVRPALEPVHILTTNAPPARVGTAYELALSANGGYSPYRWRTIGGFSLPGLKLGQEGKIVGTPTLAGGFQVTVTAIDAEGTEAEHPVTLNLEVATQRRVRPLVVKTKEIPVLRVGEPVKLALSCEGGAGPYRWQANGPLPEGLRLEGTDIVGTPNATARQEVTLVVLDSVGETGEARYLVRVERLFRATWLWWALGLLALAMVALLILGLRRLPKPIAETPPEPPVPAPLSHPWPLEIITKSVPNARASCPYSVQLACVGGTPPYRWQLVEGPLPDGMTLDASGRLHGKPFEGVAINETLKVPFHVRVEDARGLRDTQAL